METVVLESQCRLKLFHKNISVFKLKPRWVSQFLRHSPWTWGFSIFLPFLYNLLSQHLSVFPSILFYSSSVCKLYKVNKCYLSISVPNLPVTVGTNMKFLLCGPVELAKNCSLEKYPRAIIKHVFTSEIEIEDRDKSESMNKWSIIVEVFAIQV